MRLSQSTHIGTNHLAHVKNLGSYALREPRLHILPHPEESLDSSVAHETLLIHRTKFLHRTKVIDYFLFFQVERNALVKSTNGTNAFETWVKSLI